MEKEGFKVREIYFVKRMTKEILQLLSTSKISSYDEYYHKHIKPKYASRTSQKQYEHKKWIVGIIEDFAENGILPLKPRRLPNVPSCESQIPNESVYSHMIKIADAKFKQRNLVRSSINVYHRALCTFLFFQMERGNDELSKISENDVLAYFNDPKRHRGKSQLLHVRSCLNIISDIYPDAERIVNLLPPIPNNKKVYDYLQPDDFNRIIEYVLNEDVICSLRDRAIILLAIFTGLRGCDIRAMKFSDVDLTNERIVINQHADANLKMYPLR